MQRLLVRLILVAVGLMLAVSPSLAQTAGDGALLRFVHVIPGAAAVDVYVDGQLTLTGLGYGEASSYIQAEAGMHTVTVTQRGVTTTLWQQQIDAAPGAALTMVASSTDPLGFQIYQDDLNVLALGTARVTAVHAVADAPAVDVILTDGRPMMPGLQYNQPYGTLDVPAMVYDVALVAEGDTIEDALLPPTSLAISSGTSYMAVIYGTATAPSLLLLSAPTEPSADAGYVRFAQGTPGATVDIYLNDTLVTPALSLEHAGTAFIALPAGEYSIEIGLTGESAPLVTDTFDVAADDRFTWVVLGADSEAELMRFDDPVSTISAEESVLSIVNATAEGTVSAFVAGAEVLGSVAAGESDSAILEPSEDGLSATLEVGGASETFELEDVVYGGVYYSLLAVDGEQGGRVVLLEPAALAQTTESAPGDQTIEIETEAEATDPLEAGQPTADAPEAPVAEVTLEALETPAPEATEQVQAVATAAPRGPTARVLVDPGANLHLRQFPSSSALSLELVPSGTLLSVVGRQGAEELGSEETPEPEATEYVDPAVLLTSPGEDLDPANTWLFVSYTLPRGSDITGGVTSLVETTGWVNALFLTISDAAGRPQRLADLPTVPSNRAGQTSETSTTPQPTLTPAAADSVLATVLLNEGANLHLRRNPDPAAESLQLIPSGAQVVITGRIESGEWLQATYEGQQGWIASQYVTLALNGIPYQSARLPVISTPTPTPTLEATPEAAPA